MPARFLAIALIAGIAIACTSGSSASHNASDSTATPALTPTSVATGGCSAERHASGDFNDTIESGGLTRKYILHIPASYNGSPAVPLVLAFHGYAMPADLFATYHRFAELADAKGFIVVTPWGTGEPLYWNARAGAKDPDDVAFVNDLLAKLDSSLCVDPARTYVAGYSLGGGMAELLACAMPDRVAAVGLVAAVSIACGAKAPVIGFFGTEDPLVPYEGAASANPNDNSPPIRPTISAWARNLGCDGLPTISRPATDVELSTFHNCFAGDSEALLYTVIGGGHTWPGAHLDLPVGITSKSVDATALMWDFFAAHPKSP